MSITMRSYQYPDDFELVGQFLVNTYSVEGRHRNWLQPRWEYMHYHPLLDESSLDKIGIWEDAGDVVGVVHHEHRMGEIYIEISPDYSYLKRDMLEYAQEYLYRDENEGRLLQIFINGTDDEFEAIAEDLGFHKDETHQEDMSQLKIVDPFPSINIPEGFRLKSLQEDNDLNKIHRVLHRGFNHPGEPPAEEIEGRKKMQSAPNFRKDLTIVVEAPDGNFVSFCGMWYEASNRIAYVEPVATDPDYRRMGLGKAAVLEGIRRCGELGAIDAYVGSGQTFYITMGFRKIFTCYLWTKHLDKSGYQIAYQL